jgi:hypothetical protein
MNDLILRLKEATAKASQDPLADSGAGAVLALTTALSEWPGRKHAVIFAEDLARVRIHIEHLNRIMRLANQARIAVYPVDVRTLQSGTDRTVAAEYPLTQLAEYSGGTAIRGTNDYRDAAERIIGELQNHYELRWLPTADWNGKRITASLKRAGYRIRSAAAFYEGYEKADALLTEALEQRTYPVDARLKLGLFRFWPTADGKWLCSAHAQLPGQEYYFLMRLRKAGGEPVYRGTHHAEEPVPLEPGEYTLDAAMYSDTTHELGGARTTIEVPEMPKGAYIGDAMPVRGKGRPTLSANSVEDPLRLPEFRLLPATDGTFAVNEFVPFFLTMGGLRTPVPLNGELSHGGKSISRMRLPAPASDGKGHFLELTGVDMKGMEAGEYALTVWCQVGAERLYTEMRFRMR